MEYKHICAKCTKEVIYKSYKSWYSAKSRNSMCRSCRTSTANKSPKRNVKKENNPAWKGYKEIPYSWFSRYFERKRKRKPMTGSITIQEVYEMWERQDKRCALSGIKIGFASNGDVHTCSIDRIDSMRNYSIDNIQLVHKDINLMKNKFDNQYFIELCKKIAHEQENNTKR